MGIVNPPNETDPGNRATSTSSQERNASPVSSPNGGLTSAGHSMPRSRQASPVSPARDQFQIGTSGMMQPPSAKTIGTGEVPINPWDAKGNPSQAKGIPLAIKRPKK